MHQHHCNLHLDCDFAALLDTLPGYATNEPPPAWEFLGPLDELEDEEQEVLWEEVAIDHLLNAGNAVLPIRFVHRERHGRTRYSPIHQSSLGRLDEALDQVAPAAVGVHRAEVEFHHAYQLYLDLLDLRVDAKPKLRSDQKAAHRDRLLEIGFGRKDIGSDHTVIALMKLAPASVLDSVDESRLRELHESSNWLPVKARTWLAARFD